ncbi:hypothetical protein KJY78_03605 [Canibacter sp. lx-45]|uniref:glycerophosphodiester phosphodiesterase family protein n=1 Tax=Canibacter zhuwentaonis TaxID=2837491 RepID=UPI001BDCF7AF|nr:glycerophosphodiester phosphodiesterase family protein [Canibacter zhuwentaonis]MBT1035436.1 hypothetical protein [Canibacter zhuwentaonis]
MVTVFAHRGLSSQAPENTRAAFKLAHSIPGVRWIEFDLAITADEVPVIIHDDEMDRTSDMCGEVSQLAYSDIKNASVGAWYDVKFAAERIMTLAEMVDFSNSTGMNLNIELKGVTGKNGYALTQAMIRELKKELARLNREIQTLISSFNFTQLKLAQQHLPEISRAVLFEAHTFYNDWRTIAEYCGAQAINLEDKKVTRALVAEIKNAGYQLNVWTVNNRVRANELKNWGVDGIFTDFANELSYLQ